MTRIAFISIGIAIGLLTYGVADAQQEHSTKADARSAAWKRHTIDDTSRGADGVRLGDINSDGRPDVCTGWEEGGEVRVYLHPGPAKCQENWPRVTVGKVKNPEDAVFVDLDHDGTLDVVSCCEGKTQAIFVHWAPKGKNKLLDAAAWQTDSFEVCRGKSRWMFCLPMDVDGDRSVDLVVGSKNPNGQVGWLKSPAEPRDLSKWKYQKITDAGWIMSLRRFPSRSNRSTFVISDRKGKHSGVYILQLKANGTDGWKKSRVGKSSDEVMFLDHLRDQQSDLLAVATRNGFIRMYSADLTRSNPAWQLTASLANPFQIKEGKAVAIGDIDLDGIADLVYTANTGVNKNNRGKPGVSWISDWQTAGKQSGSPFQSISGSQGRKFDRIELIDVDADGDLDVITCEESANLGVIWYENPAK